MKAFEQRCKFEMNWKLLLLGLFLSIFVMPLSSPEKLVAAAVVVELDSQEHAEGSDEDEEAILEYLNQSDDDYENLKDKLKENLDSPEKLYAFSYRLMRKLERLKNRFKADKLVENLQRKSYEDSYAYRWLLSYLKVYYTSNSLQFLAFVLTGVAAYLVEDQWHLEKVLFWISNTASFMVNFINTKQTSCLADVSLHSDAEAKDTTYINKVENMIWHIRNMNASIHEFLLLIGVDVEKTQDDKEVQFFPISSCRPESSSMSVSREFDSSYREEDLQEEKGLHGEAIEDPRWLGGNQGFNGMHDPLTQRRFEAMRDHAIPTLVEFIQHLRKFNKILSKPV